MLNRGHHARRTNDAGHLPRRLILVAVAGLGLSLLAALASVSAASAGDGGPARTAGLAASPRSGAGASTKLTIQIWHSGVFGYVESTKPGECAQGRSVGVLMRQGKRTKRIGTATARRRDGRYQWSIKTKTSGELSQW
jgi:hypothetical protein